MVQRGALFPGQQPEQRLRQINPAQLIPPPDAGHSRSQPLWQPLEINGTTFQLRPGDALRYVLNGPSRFTATGRREARYVLSLVHP